MQNFPQEIFSQREGWPFSIKSKCSWDVRSEFRDESQIWVEDWLHTFANSHTANQGWHHHHGEVSLSLFKAPTFFCQPTKKGSGWSHCHQDRCQFVCFHWEGGEGGELMLEVLPSQWPAAHCHPPGSQRPQTGPSFSSSFSSSSSSPSSSSASFFIRRYIYKHCH